MSDYLLSRVLYDLLYLICPRLFQFSSRFRLSLLFESSPSSSPLSPYPTTHSKPLSLPSSTFPPPNHLPNLDSLLPYLYILLPTTLPIHPTALHTYPQPTYIPTTIHQVTMAACISLTGRLDTISNACSHLPNRDPWILKPACLPLVSICPALACLPEKRTNPSRSTRKTIPRFVGVIAGV